MKKNLYVWGVVLMALVYLWVRLINNLRIEWATDPQYGYGLIVPFLCGGLFLRRYASAKQAPPNPSAGKILGVSSVIFTWLFALCYLPVRLVEAATPEWRIIQWVFGIMTVGVTLGVIWTTLGKRWMTELAFPISFILVAIPWPTLFEAPIIQGLTHFSALVVMQMLYVAGVPALLHGNLIQVASGIVGIEEACSGIRSFQTSLMTCLFLGEFFRLRIPWRILFIPAGFLLALIFNIGRMFFLTMIAAHNGVAAIEAYHDPAGVSTALFCTAILWLLGYWLWRRQNAETSPHSTGPNKVVSDGTSQPGLNSSKIQYLGWALAGWLALVEVGVHAWYYERDQHIHKSPDWTFQFPSENPSFKSLAIDETTRNLLRYDQGKEGTWTAPDGTFWQAFYFDWRPGRVAGYLAKRHTPEICLTAMGLKMEEGPQLSFLDVHGIELPIRRYVFANDTSRVQVFHCRWESGASRDAYVQNESARYNLVRAVWEGRGDRGQKVFEIIVSGETDPETAWRDVTNQLEQSISVTPAITQTSSTSKSTEPIKTSAVFSARVLPIPGKGGS